MLIVLLSAALAAPASEVSPASPALPLPPSPVFAGRPCLPAPVFSAQETPWLQVVRSEKKPGATPIEKVIAQHPVIPTPDLKTHHWPRVIGGELVPVSSIPSYTTPAVSYTPGYMPGYMPSYTPTYSAPACIGGNCYGGR